MEESETNTEPLFAEERKEQILDILRVKNKVVVSDLVEQFDVSAATIRNDLADLEQAGRLKRTHGGALSIGVTKAGFEPDHYQRQVENLPQKRAIARRAIELVDDDDILLLDTGTTTFELAKLLTEKRDITVVVNDIAIARYLEDTDNNSVILVGGTLRKRFHCTVGPFATEMLAGLSVDKVFVATNGLSAGRGLSTPDINQAKVKEAMVAAGSRVVVLVDSSKVGIHSFVQFAPITAVDTVVTDDKAENEALAELREAGVDVLVGESGD